MPTPGHANWKVGWVHKGKVHLKWIGTDFQEALRIRDLAVQKGRKSVTLICANFGFEPPPELKPQMKKFIKKERIKRKGKTRIRKFVVEREIIPMRQKNLEGIWWCPYCVKLRKFVFKESFVHEGQRVKDPGYYCPMCGISHRDGTVRKWNPVGERMYMEPGRLTRHGTARTRRKSYKQKGRKRARR